MTAAIPNGSYPLRPRDFLTEVQCEALTRAVLQACLDRGVDPNDGATPAQCEAALEWGASIVFEFHALLEVIARNEGIAVVRAERGRYRVALLRSTIDRVIASAMSGAIAASARRA